MVVEMQDCSFSTPSLALPLVRGCCRFSGFTTTAYPLRGCKGEEIIRGLIMTKARIGIVTISDRASRGEYEDKSGDKCA